MELDENTLNASWSKNDNNKPQFFIINEAIISKLCTLGVENEPCFEGSNITAPTIQFAFEDGFKEQLFSMMSELKDLLNKGRNIATTHTLFHLFDQEIIDLCYSQGYILIMDEVTDVIEPF